MPALRPRTALGAPAPTIPVGSGPVLGSGCSRLIAAPFLEKAACGHQCMRLRRPPPPPGPSSIRREERLKERDGARRRCVPSFEL